MSDFCYLAICFFFSRGESDSNGIIRAFISNPKLIILISKTLIFIILGVDSLINNNSRAIIPLFSFFSGCLVFYSFFLENYFDKKCLTKDQKHDIMNTESKKRRQKNDRRTEKKFIRKLFRRVLL